MDASGSWFLKSGSGSGSAKKTVSISIRIRNTAIFKLWHCSSRNIEPNKFHTASKHWSEAKSKHKTYVVYTTVLQTICGICMCGMVPSRNYGMHIPHGKGIRTLQQMLIVWQSVGIITVRYVRYLLSYWLLRVLNCHGTRSVETIQYACSQAFFLLYT